MKFSLCAIVLALAPNIVMADSEDDNWDSTFGIPGSNLGGVSTIVHHGEYTYFGGNFTQIGGIDAWNIAKWDGGDWSPLGEGVKGFVGAMVVVGDNLYIAGSLHEAGGVSVLNIARWDGTNWWDVGGGVNNVVFDLASDGQNLYAGGHFTLAGGIQASKIAKWDGTNWSALGNGIIPVNEGGVSVGAVDSLEVNGAEVFAGGRFRNAGGVAATNIARWDGETWHAIGDGLRYVNGPGAENGVVRSLMFHQEVLYVGGSFRLAGNVAATNIARWNGVSWQSMGHANNTVHAIVPHGDTLFVGGSFRSIGGVNARIVAQWDGNNWSPLGSGILGGAISGGLASNGFELFVGGTFTTAGGHPSTNIALWHIPYSLNISQTANQVQITWPSTGTNFLLEAKEGLQSTNWSEVGQTPGFHDEQCVVTEPITASNRVYRLRRKLW